MKPYSFRIKITFTLIIVVSSISFFAFFIYNNTLSKRIYKNYEEDIVSVLDLLKDQFYLTIIDHDGRIIKSILKNVVKNKEVYHTYLVNSEGEVTYPDDYESLGVDTLTINELVDIDKDVTFKTYRTGHNPFSRTFIRMRNSPKCYECHSPLKEQLGFIVIDFSMNKTKKNIAFTRKASICFTIIMVIVIVSFVILIHYKSVRKSLFRFQSSINTINRGNLDERLEIPESKELGELGKSFNKMLDNFQKTQKQLQIYHQRELQSSQKLATIGEMASRLAHEIRNPITGIANAIEIIVDETKDENNKPILEEIQRQANRVNNAISDLLKYSRSNELNLQKGNINEIIKSLVFFLKNQPQNKNINFSLNVQAEIPPFNFDPELIENVLLNFGINAIQAIKNTGTITYKSVYKPSEKIVIISVEDTGTGIPKDKISEIFKPFYTTRTEGTGLGLAIVKDIIEKHKGEIWVSNNVNSGCTFSIALTTEIPNVIT